MTSPERARARDPMAAVAAATQPIVEPRPEAKAEAKGTSFEFMNSISYVEYLSRQPTPEHLTFQEARNRLESMKLVVDFNGPPHDKKRYQVPVTWTQTGAVSVRTNVPIEVNDDLSDSSLDSQPAALVSTRSSSPDLNQVAEPDSEDEPDSSESDDTMPVLLAMLEQESRAREQDPTRIYSII